jgi:CRP-like cAMP-binding protein
MRKPIVTVSQALLQRFHPFGSVTEDQFKAISAYLRVEAIPKGTFIIKRGKPLKNITYLLSGRVDLVDASFNSEPIEGESERCQHALTEQSPSAVSAMAKSDVKILTVDHQAFEVINNWVEATSLVSPSTVESNAQESNEDWMTSLLDSPLFAQVPPTQLQQLFTRFEPVRVAAGETIVEEGAEGDFFYVVESGQAKVLTRFDGQVATLEPGQFFGEEALVGETIRNASVIMTTTGMLMRLNKENFKALLQESLIRYIETQQLHQRILAGENCQLVDVRLPIEYRIAHVKDSVNIPLSALRKRLAGLDHDAVYVVTDDAGKRSEVAAHLMCQAGFTTYILKDSAKHYT